MTNQAISSPLGKILSIVLAIITISSIGAFAYNIARPPATERFTEFYVLNTEGKAADYPKELAIGESPSVIIGIVNREQITATYRIEVSTGLTTLNELGPLTLQQGETREEIVTFKPVAAGTDQKIEFLLFKSGQAEVYRSVYILVNVR